jgi:hypothetical protein
MVALPFGRVLEYDGRGWRIKERGTRPTDGVYGDVTIRDGVIVAVSEAELPSYIPPPCPPTPAPCSGGDNGGALTLSPDSANLSKLDAAERLLTKLVAEGKEGIRVTGAGTAQDPLVIIYEGGALTVNLSSTTPDILEVMEFVGEPNTFSVGHKTSPAAATLGGFTLDNYGHVTGYAGADTPGIMSIQAFPDTVTVQVAEGAAVVGLPLLFVTGQSFNTDTSRIDVDMFGRITGITAEDLPSAGRYSRIFQGPRTSVTLSFTTVQGGRLRGTYKGDLNITVPQGTNDGFELMALSSGLTVTLDEDVLEVYGVLDGNKVVGFEFLTPMSYDAGSHVLIINTTAQVTKPGILDVSLCL